MTAETRQARASTPVIVALRLSLAVGPCRMLAYGSMHSWRSDASGSCRMTPCVSSTPCMSTCGVLWVRRAACSGEVHYFEQGLLGKQLAGCTGSIGGC